MSGFTSSSGSGSGNDQDRHEEVKINGLSMQTALVNCDACPLDPYGASVMPIYQTATFRQPTAVDFGDYDYTRSGNPTRTALETQVALLETSKNARGFAFTTGMAALSSVVRLVQCGEEVIVNDDSYGGTYRLMSQIATRHGIVVRYVDMSGEQGPTQLQTAINHKTKLVMIESPTNPIQRICDIQALADICHANTHPEGTLLSVDNTMMSPVLCRPLVLGADLVIHSATKYMAGHSDTMAGVVIARDRLNGSKTLADSLYFYQNAEGNGIAPFDAWLVLRGLKTMPLRIKEQERNAMQIATWLQQDCNFVQQVFYPGLKSHPDYALHHRQASGGGAVVCFVTGNVALSEHIVTNTKLFKITVSFGSVSSLISIPGRMSHASIPSEVRAARSFPEDLVRMSIGIEDVQDLIDDLKQAADSYFAQHGSSSTTNTSTSTTSTI